MSLPVAFCYSVEKLCVKWNSSAHHLHCCSSYRTNRRSGHQSIHQTKDRLLSNLKSFSASANGSIFRFINPAFSPKERDVRVASWPGLFGYRWRQRLQQGSHLLHPRPTVVPPCRTWAGEVPASPFPWVLLQLCSVRCYGHGGAHCLQILGPLDMNAIKMGCLGMSAHLGAKDKAFLSWRGYIFHCYVDKSTSSVFLPT